MIFTPTDIQTRLRERPFTPMQIVTTTGQTYDVPHPELVIVSAHFIMVGTPTRNDPSQAERITRVALVHIVELRELPMPSQSSNGSA